MSTTIIYETPTLYALNKKGTKKYWQGLVTTNGNDYFTETRYWSQKKDGSLGTINKSEPTLIQGKNKGKKNETTPRQQAELTINSLLNKQLSKGYVKEGNNINDIAFYPMLAKTAVLDKLTFPLVLQPKLDGIRALLINGKFYSRNANLIPALANIEVPINENIILDGELLIDGANFQDTIAATKKLCERSKLLTFWVFDAYIKDEPDLGWDKRLFKAREYVIECMNISYPTIAFLPYFQIKARDALISYHSLFIQQGYEGSIIRYLDKPYEVGHRSSYLLKYKDFDEKEFTITGGTSGTGKEEQAVIFICETDEGKNFDVRPRGSLDYRKALWSDIDNLIGKHLTVRFQAYTKEGIPRFPVGIAIRDYE